MKNFFISEMLLLSQKDKKAKRIVFDKRRTIILGKNNTGKSSLIKSIYWAFGAEPSLHPNFKNTQAAVLVRFSVMGIKYEILRDGKRYSIYNGESKDLIRTFNSVTKELAPYLSELFDFKPLLQTQGNEFVIPPPAFLFLPFYIDQDESWTSSWSSFGSLQYIRDYRSQLISYHSGIRPNAYYQFKKELDEYSKKIDEIEKERKVTNNILVEMREKFTQLEFNIDIEIFQSELKDLLVECEKLKKIEEKAKYKLRDLYTIKSSVDSQLEIVKHALDESHLDLQFASKALSTHVDCPTCGAHYDNNFSERFAIADDEERCKDLLIELSKDQVEVNGKINEQNSILVNTKKESLVLEQILEQKKGELKFKDVLDNFGKNQLREIFTSRIDDLNKNLYENAIIKKDLTAKLKALEDKDRKADILSYYQSTLTKFLKILDVHSISPDSYKSLTNVIENSETGSARPRALIAYYFTFFYLMAEYSTTTYCPLIIDSPNQQDQDIEHIDQIMDFIKENQPRNTQMILGVAELYNTDFNGKIIELKEKYSLLQSSEYDLINKEMSTYFDKMWLRLM